MARSFALASALLLLCFFELKAAETFRITPRFNSQWPDHFARPSTLTAIQNGRGFSVLPGSGVGIFDLTNPTNIISIGGFEHPQVSAVALLGNLLYLTDRRHGITVVDATDPENLKTIGAVWGFSGFQDIQIDGQFAYVVGDRALKIFDLTDPSNPSLVGTLPDFDEFYPSTRVYLGNNLVFLAQTEWLAVVEVSNKATPRQVSIIVNGFNPKALSVGNLVYIGDGSGLHIYDLSTPSAPRHLARFSPEGSLVSSLALTGNTLLIGTQSRVELLDVSNPEDPVRIGSYPTLAIPGKIHILGNFAFIRHRGLDVLDVSNPTAPALIFKYPDIESGSGAAANENYLVHAAFSAGVFILDRSGPRLQFLSHVDTPGDALGVALHGNHAFIPDGYSGLQVLDLSSPRNPRLVTTVPARATRAVVLSGDFLFKADAADGIQILNVSNPSIPILVGFCDTPGFASALAFSDNHLFVADGSSGLQIIDAANPAQPKIIGSLQIGDITAVAVRGDYAFLANNNTGIEIVDVAVPASPRFVSSYKTRGSPNSLAILGDNLLVTEITHGMSVLRITDPTNPVLNWRYSPAGSWRGVSVSGDAALLSGSFGVHLLSSIPDAQRSLVIHGAGNATLTLEASASLGPQAAWTPLLTTNLALPFTYTDFDVQFDRWPQKFYRAMQNSPPSSQRIRRANQ